MLDNLLILCMGGIAVLGLFCIVGAIAEWRNWK